MGGGGKNKKKKPQFPICTGGNPQLETSIFVISTCSKNPTFSAEVAKDEQKNKIEILSMIPCRTAQSEQNSTAAPPAGCLSCCSYDTHGASNNSPHLPDLQEKVKAARDASRICSPHLRYTAGAASEQTLRWPSYNTQKGNGTTGALSAPWAAFPAAFVDRSSSVG
jgi:hypothetical protein